MLTIINGLIYVTKRRSKKEEGEEGEEEGRGSRRRGEGRRKIKREIRGMTFKDWSRNQ